MSRETAPYLLTPVGPIGERRAIHVLGPKIGPSYSELRAEVERLQQRVEDESALRIKLQERLSQCARVFAVLSHLYPELRGLIQRARKDIWNA